MAEQSSTRLRRDKIYDDAVGEIRRQHTQRAEAGAKRERKRWGERG